jgi:hypothetical protein
MSSANSARKFDLRPYHAYVERLPTIAEVRAGRAERRAAAPAAPAPASLAGDARE